ncbi:MAG: 1-deoxy-D-xylulose-5-phosphate synthase [Clostridia bacterium]|nr:1-deoxy-D-xylulose-5-phosphate synthase [Clostridia bacterium]
MEDQNYPLLSRIHSPADLKAMREADMPKLADEIRAFLVEHVTETGGHLASNLGVVELSIALHRVFDCPHDHIIFDVGHQSYIHKLLTGRREAFSTLRQPGGLSGFTRREESEYDAFGAGHSSTSVSAAVGFAEADKLSGSDAFSVAVVGDGAFTGGMIHEALNNCRGDLNLVIVLNENEMSIGPNIGRFAASIARIRSSPRYLRTKSRTQKVLNRLPLIGRPLYSFFRGVKKRLKNMLFSSNYFEELGLFYLGPANGNNYRTVERLLRAAKNKGESVIVHLKTAKGKGYPEAEEHPERFHGVPPAGTVPVRNFSAEMGERLLALAREDSSVCAVTASMTDSTGLAPFARELPERFFDVGIAEEHAATFCAGLAAEGKKPFFAVYSSFLQRSYDSLIHDIALQRLPVVLCVDRAGIARADGPTHHGVFDVSFLSGIPHFTLYAPASFASLGAALGAALRADGPVAIRYPNAGEDPAILSAFFTGEGEALAPKRALPGALPSRAVVLTYGRIAAEALKAQKELEKEGIGISVILLETLKPYDAAADAVLPLLPPEAERLIFLEEGIRAGGAGMMLFDALSRRAPAGMAGRRTAILAIGDAFSAGELGRPMFETLGISAADVIRAVKEP